MKASQLADYLRNLIEEYGDLELVYSIDDEDNDFKKVHYNASVGNYDEENREFHQSKDKPNTICIN